MVEKPKCELFESFRARLCSGFSMFSDAEIEEGILEVAPNTLPKKITIKAQMIIQGVFFNWYPPKKLKYGKPRLGESTLT